MRFVGSVQIRLLFSVNIIEDCTSSSPVACLWSVLIHVEVPSPRWCQACEHWHAEGCCGATPRMWLEPPRPQCMELPQPQAKKWIRIRVKEQFRRNMGICHCRHLECLGGFHMNREKRVEKKIRKYGSCLESRHTFQVCPWSQTEKSARRKGAGSRADSPSFCASILRNSRSFALTEIAQRHWIRLLPVDT